jgi:nuclear transcription factor Y, alpha
MMTFKNHEGFGPVGALNQASNGAGAPLPWWAGPQLLYGDPAPLSPEETRQFQVVPGAPGSPDPAPPSAKRPAAPEVLKFSVFQGKAFFYFPLCAFASVWGCTCSIFFHFF